MRPRGPRILPRRPTTGIMSGVAITRSKSDRPLPDFLGQFLGADDIGARRRGFLGLGIAGEHQHPDALAGAVGQGNGAAHILVGVAGVDAEIHRHLDGLVEFRVRPLLDDADGFPDRVEPIPFQAFAGVAEAFSGARHVYPTTSIPIERAEPARMRTAASTSLAFRSFIFSPAICSSCLRVTEPATMRPGSVEPLSSLAAFLMK